MTEKAILFDATKCIGCRGCQVACKQWNGLSAVATTNTGTYENPPDLSPDTWLTMKFREKLHNGTINWFFGRRSCMHCTDAVCVAVCPPRALYRHEYGFVAYDKSKCIGCGYCVEHCPFGVPRLDASIASGVGKMDKCTLCTTAGLDRISAGQQPACVKTCPSRALIYGERSELIAEGKRRVAASQASTGAIFYGEHEMGGLHVLAVLAASPETYELPANPRFSPAATLRKNTSRPWVGIVLGAVSIGLAVNVLVARANQLRQQERRQHASKRN